MNDTSRGAVFARVVLLVAGLVALARLASHAWLEGPDLDAPVPSAAPGDVAAPARPTPFLLCIVDGLREEAPADVSDPIMPLWRELAAEGVSGVATTGEPTLTAACVRTLLTGRNPDLAAAAKNFSADVVRENLVERLAVAGARVGHAGDASAYQLARPWYREADVLAVRDQGPGDQGGTDDRALPFALARIADGVDGMTVHLTRPDHAGHVHGAALGRDAAGALSPYGTACRRADEQLRVIVTAFRARHPDALVVIAADHGVTAIGTHGGGEEAARRAPFVAVGPLIESQAPVELSQAALASTMAVWLGVAPLAFAEAPPALALARIPPAAKRAALEAYVNVRLAVAFTTGARDLAEAIAVRRARLSAEGPDAALARLADEARALDERMATAHDPWRVAGALALACLLWFLAADGRGAMSARGARYALVASLVALLASVSIGSVGLASGVVALAACAALATRTRPFPARAVAASLATFVGLAYLSFALKPYVETPAALASAGVGLASAAALLVGVAGYALLARSTRAWIAARARAMPAVLLVGLGVLLGFPTSLRSFVDPFVDLSLVYAVVAVGVLGFACFGPSAHGAAPRARFVLLVAGAAAIFAPHGLMPDSRLLAGPVVVGTIGWLAVAARRDARSLRTTFGFASACLGVAAAMVARGGEPPAVAPYWIALVASLGALGCVGRAGGDVALGARLAAALALALLFERVGAGPALRFALAVAGAFAASRLAAPTTRTGAIGFAVAIALMRIAIFHAMGFSETLSTVNTGAGVVPGVATTGEIGWGLTPAVLANVLVQGLRFALPWIVLLSAAARMFERRPDGAPAGSRQLVLDLAALLAIRGAALILAMWVWWPSAWWVTTARAVFAFATGDVLLVLTSAFTIGVFARVPAVCSAGIRPSAAGES